MQNGPTVFNLLLMKKNGILKSVLSFLNTLLGVKESLITKSYLC